MSLTNHAGLKGAIRLRARLPLLLLLLLLNCRSQPQGAQTPRQHPSIHPANQFAYVMDADEYQLYQYRVREDGTLTPVAPPFLCNEGIVPVATAHHVYVDCAYFGRLFKSQKGKFGKKNGTYGIVLFPIAPDGSLGSSKSIINYFAKTSPTTLTPSPTNSILYSVEINNTKHLPIPNPIGEVMPYQLQLDSYHCRPDGSLLLAASVALPTVLDAGTLAVTASGQYGYLPCDNTIRIFRLSPMGQIQTLGPAVTDPEQTVQALALDSNGPYLYVLGKQYLYVCGIQTDGSLRLHSSAHFKFPTEWYHPALFVEPGGRFLYATCEDRSIIGFRVLCPGIITQFSHPAFTDNAAFGQMIFDTQRPRVFIADARNSSIRTMTINSDGTLSARHEATVSRGASPYGFAVYSP